MPAARTEGLAARDEAVVGHPPSAMLDSSKCKSSSLRLIATSNKCIAIATRNKCLTSSNKKLVVTSASLLVTRALLVTRFATRGSWHRY